MNTGGVRNWGAAPTPVVNPNLNPTTGHLVLNPGTVLPNGAIVIAVSCREADRYIILALRPGWHASDNYVTWKANRPGNGETYWGNYFDNIVEAVEDFLNR
jgi:hypothetical protein